MTRSDLHNLVQLNEAYYTLAARAVEEFVQNLLVMGFKNVSESHDITQRYVYPLPMGNIIDVYSRVGLNELKCNISYGSDRQPTVMHYQSIDTMQKDQIFVEPTRIFDIGEEYGDVAYINTKLRHILEDYEILTQFDYLAQLRRKEQLAANDDDVSGIIDI